MSVYDAIHKRHQKFVMNQQISCSAWTFGPFSSCVLNKTAQCMS